MPVVDVAVVLRNELVVVTPPVIPGCPGGETPWELTWLVAVTVLVLAPPATMFVPAICVLGV